MKTDITLRQCPCHSDRLLNVLHKSAFELIGCDEILEFKITPFHSDSLATCHMKRFKFIRKSKTEKVFRKDNKA